PRTGRGAVTLIEVLVAIFVVAIGLMALLTLFPLGALSMAQAVKDDRTAHVAYNMNAIARAYWEFNLESIATNGTDYESPINDPNNGALTSPGGGLPALRTKNPPYTGPSYPVYMDFWGSTAYSGNWKTWLAGQQGGVPRRSLGAPFSNTANPWTGNIIAL